MSVFFVNTIQYMIKLIFEQNPL